VAEHTESCGVLFDVDGTLVDTVYLHAPSWTEALHQAGHEIPTAVVHRSVGMGSTELLDHLIGNGRDSAEDEKIRSAHLAPYAQHWGRLRPLPGAAALLRECAARGLRVVLASSASERELTVLRSALDAEDAITCATSSSDAKAGKPSPDILLVALRRAGLSASAAVLIGDSVWDAAAAQAARLPFIGLTCGGISEAELQLAGAIEVHADPSALLSRISVSRIAGLGT
jgi:HAD superfamily hydrolase (TIGR01509 family)